MKRFVIIICAAAALAGCDRQRDLYITVDPLIRVEGDWMPSLGRDDMSMDATVVAYAGGKMYAKEYFYNPGDAEIAVERGEFDVMIFNGLMYGADDTHLNGVFFRNIDQIETFEAVAAEAEPIRRLGRAEGEYVANNDMEIFTSMTARRAIEGDRAYHVKYRDGEGVDDIPENYVEATLAMTPQAMSYEVKITARITNISSAYGANAAIYGFAGSAFAAERKPSHFLVTHQFNLNNKVVSDPAADIGTIESPAFVTFGPPVDMPENTYSVYVRITLVDGNTFEETVDVGDQVLPFIERVRRNIEGAGPVEYGMTLPIVVELTLPVVEPIQGSVGLGDWEDDEIIRVPVTAQ